MADTDSFSDVEIVAKTIFGEARGEPDEGKQAVANVIKNRVDSRILWWGTTFRSVCLAPRQFDCWDADDPNRAVIMSATSDDPVYARCLEIAASAIDDSLADNTNGSTSYYALSMRRPPPWADAMTQTVTIGSQVFFKV